MSHEIQKPSGNPSVGLTKATSGKSWFQKLEAASGRPVTIEKGGIHKPKKIGAVYLLIDCSESMAHFGKLEDARKGALAFATDAIRKTYSVGLGAFASSSKHLITPTQSLEEIGHALRDMIADESTDLASGLSLASEVLMSQEGERVICVVTDGMPDNKDAAIKAAIQAKARKIDIMTIGTDDADETFLAQIASRKELSMKVPRTMLQTSLPAMSRLLPGPTSTK